MYGKLFPTQDRKAIELWCFAHDPPLGLGRYHHLREAVDLIWNAREKDSFIWNDWTERMMRAFSEEDWVTLTGPAASWKTTSAAVYALSTFFSDPPNTVVICTSTTLDGLRRRIWKEIGKYFRLRPLFGHMVQSRNCIQYRKGHDDSGIFGLATDKGEIEKAIGKIIGFHAPKILVIVDEMPYTPEAIVEACVNLETGARRFEFKGLGNADDQLDPHGRMCEPLKGWDSISVETEQWETRRGLCIHLDGLKSPNVLDRTKNYPGLLCQSDIDTTAEVYGVDSPQFWQMRRGFWAPEGIQKTVLSMPMIVRAGAMESVSFDQSAVPVAALDPAFDGRDRCPLRFGRCGKVNGKNVLLMEEIELLKTKNRPDDPTHYQIARQVKEMCAERGVQPYFFGLDSTGEGGGLASILQQEWSREILCVEFGGMASDRPVSITNSKPCNREYHMKVTELWFYFRLLVLNEQIKGLDYETAAEFCRRNWTMRGSLIALESKEKMRDRTRKSPDLSDCAVVMAQVCSERCNLSPRESAYSEPGWDSPWKRFLQKRSIQSDYAATLPY
jgi:hypothetical protein